MAYIDREELIEAGRAIKLKEICPDWNVPRVAKALEQQGQTFLKLIKKAPTEDVEKVKHGEWKPKHYEGGFMDGTNFEECSICRYRRYFDDIRFKLTFDYCPKCGAKMDLKEGAEK